MGAINIKDNNTFGVRGARAADVSRRRMAGPDGGGARDASVGDETYYEMLNY